MLKVCKKCGVEKTLSGFYRNKECSFGHENICKKCRNAHTVKSRDKTKHNKNAKVWRDKNADMLRSQESARYHSDPEKRKNQHYLKRYGITLKEAAQLLVKQFGQCLICSKEISVEIGVPNTAHVDHCHTDGGVRGLLCSHCNTGLGLFNDDRKRLINAIRYLDNYYGNK
jgi:hypothetical protein